MLGELTGKFSIDVQFEIIALSNDVHIIPLPFFYVGHVEPVDGVLQEQPASVRMCLRAYVGIGTATYTNSSSFASTST